MFFHGPCLLLSGPYCTVILYCTMHWFEEKIQVFIDIILCRNEFGYHVMPLFETSETDTLRPMQKLFDAI